MHTRATTDAMQWTPAVIEERLTGVLLVVLNVNESQVHLDALLADDLKAGQSDLAAISVRVHQAFNISTDDLFWDVFIRKNHPQRRKYLDRDGRLTTVGAQEFISRAPWMQWSEDDIRAGDRAHDFLAVGYIQRYIEYAFNIPPT